MALKVGSIDLPNASIGLLDAVALALALPMLGVGIIAVVPVPVTMLGALEAPSSTSRRFAPVAKQAFKRGTLGRRIP